MILKTFQARDLAKIHFLIILASSPVDFVVLKFDIFSLNFSKIFKNFSSKRFSLISQTTIEVYSWGEYIYWHSVIVH